jgi:hypothetical protein
MEMDNTFDIHISQVLKFLNLTSLLNFLGQIVVYLRHCSPCGSCPIMQLEELCIVFKQMPTPLKKIHPILAIQGKFMVMVPLLKHQTQGLHFYYLTISN